MAECCGFISQKSWTYCYCVKNQDEIQQDFISKGCRAGGPLFTVSSITTVDENAGRFR